MIWFDITDPKYALFFAPVLKILQKNRVKFLVTARRSAWYSELSKIIQILKIPAIFAGGHGGESATEKFLAREKRQKLLLKILQNQNEMPRVFVTGASVEGTQIAFGLGMKILQFSDTPIAGHENLPDLITKVARLTLPLSSVIFHPFVVPRAVYENFGVERIFAYDFLDPALYFQDLGRKIHENSPDPREKREFLRKIGAQNFENSPIFLVREEEYAAHYVARKNPVIYEAIQLLAELPALILVMPRYVDPKNFATSDFSSFLTRKNVKILAKKLRPDEFYPHITALIGGGGTMNLEAAFLGVRVLSVRSLLLFHDIFLLQNSLMTHHKTAREIFMECEKIALDPKPRCDTRAKFFENGVLKTVDFGFFLCELNLPQNLSDCRV